MGNASLELKPEIVLETREVYSGRIVHLRVDKVRLNDGSESTREIVAHRGAVCIVPLLDTGNILMVRQFRLAAGESLLEVPAGTLEEGEEPIVCAARELEEETGYTAAELKPLFSAFLAPGYSTELMHAFLATGLSPASGNAHMDSDEHILLESIPLAEIRRLLENGGLRDSKSIAALYSAISTISPK